MIKKTKKVKEIKGKKSIKKEIKILFILIIVLVVINYQTIDNFLKNFFNTNQRVYVDRVLDGDTIEGENRSIRLLGINTPERGEFLYEEAKGFLKDYLLNKNVTLEFVGDRRDKYGRLLAYVFLDGENVNIKMVENGFANYYFYGGKDKYSDELLNAWNMCLTNNVNLCEKSDDVCSVCIKISDSSLINNCSFSCNITNWQVRGEGREKFIFSENILAPNEKTYFVLDLKNTGGSLFLRDAKGKLVEWKKENKKY